jgi:hypothetical protein
MEAKKKASELVLGYLVLLGNQPKEAKECALLTVEEILTEANLMTFEHDFKTRKNYWEDVMKAIKEIKIN